MLSGIFPSCLWWSMEANLILIFFPQPDQTTFQWWVKSLGAGPVFSSVYLYLAPHIHFLFAPNSHCKTHCHLTKNLPAVQLCQWSKYYILQWSSCRWLLEASSEPRWVREREQEKDQRWDPSTTSASLSPFPVLPPTHPHSHPATPLYSFPPTIHRWYQLPSTDGGWLLCWHTCTAASHMYWWPHSISSCSIFHVWKTYQLLISWLSSFLSLLSHWSSVVFWGGGRREILHFSGTWNPV